MACNLKQQGLQYQSLDTENAYMVKQKVYQYWLYTENAYMKVHQ